MMPIVGFLPATDPRMHATIDAVADRLTDEHGFVYRYLNEDGLTGGEGTFGICTFWLAECLAWAGEVERARALFDRMASARTTSGCCRRRSTRRRVSCSGTSAGIHAHRTDPRRVGDRGSDALLVTMPAPSRECVSVRERGLSSLFGRA